MWYLICPARHCKALRSTKISSCCLYLATSDLPQSRQGQELVGQVQELNFYAMLQGWPIPDKYSNIHRFLDAIKSRPSWGPAAPVNDDVVEDGWRTKIKQKKESS